MFTKRISKDLDRVDMLIRASLSSMTVSNSNLLIWKDIRWSVILTIAEGL
jgi:hypothetical protein